MDRVVPGSVLAPVSTWLRIEDLAVFVLSLQFYWHYGQSWVWYLVLFLVPDLSMLGYFLGSRIGALFYNAVHWYVGPLVLVVVGWNGPPVLRAVALIWIGHIAFDRLLGYGLKYPTAFGDTHLGMIGNKKKQSET